MNATQESTSQVEPISPATLPAAGLPGAASQRIEELGRIIMAYSEVTENLQRSHDQLKSQVQHLRSELSEKNRMLERRNRLAALGEMAAGMAHEIRNPLGGIQLYASMLSDDLRDREDARKVVEKIQFGVKRLEVVVSQILQFSREIRLNAARCSLREMLEQTLELTAQQCARHNIDVQLACDSAICATIDANLFSQAVLNLLLNAIDAMAARGAAETSHNDNIVQLEVERAEGRSDAKQFVLRVRDRGDGIAPDVIDKIFNPFFTTRDSGTGLGLAIVHRIIEAHDGSIAVKNHSDGGAVFEIKV